MFKTKGVDFLAMGETYKQFKRLLSDFVYSSFFEIFVIFCIITSVTFLLVDSSMELNKTVQAVIRPIELGLNLFFIFEYLARIFLAPNRWIFVKKNLIDLIALLPILRFFRLVRILRLIRIIKIIRSSQWGTALTNRSSSLGAELQGKAVEASVISFVLATIILTGSVGILIFEKGQNEQFQGFLDGFWWSIVTLTTVGYGDKFPITTGGRILAVVIMLLGLSFFALITGFVSSFIMQRYKREEFTGMDLIGVKNHIIICGWNSNASTVIEELLSLYKNELKHFVVIAEEQPDYFFSERIHFVKGDFTRREILGRAQIEYASSVIVLADTTSERGPQDVDARTILASLAIERINSDIYTCVEILSPENVDHITNAGVDEFIISAKYTGNLLAHSVKNPGITKVYNELLRSTEGNQIYKIPVSTNMANRSFKECAIEFLEKQIGILIGLERNKNHLINPQDEIVRDTDTLLLIANHETADY
ncbi:ion transporter [bacterium]|nr:ion transporter [bacterium]